MSFSSSIVAWAIDYKIDVIIAGPPCQGFSLTGARRKDDDRNKLFYSVFKLAKRLKPQAVIIENVPGLATLYEGHAKDAILEEFQKLKLTSNYKVLFAPDFEVPQIRRRIFFVGLNSKLGTFEFPKEVLTQYIAAFSQQNNISNQEAEYFIFKGKIKNQAYNKEAEPIRILKKDKTIEDVVEASDQLNLKALSKPVTKYFICFPKQLIEN